MVSLYIGETNYFNDSEYIAFADGLAKHGIGLVI